MVVGTSLPEDDRPDAIEEVVGLPPPFRSNWSSLSPELGRGGSLVPVGGVDLLAFLASEVGVGHGTTGITRGPSPGRGERAGPELPENEVEAIAFLSELSDVIRTYLEEALQSPASRSTAEYLADALPFLPVASRDP